MTVQNLSIGTGIFGLFAGIAIGYLIASKKNNHHYLYEFTDIEDYGDEEEYDVFSSLPQETGLENFRPVMKAEVKM